VGGVRAERPAAVVAGPFQALPTRNSVVQRLSVQPVALVDWDPIQSVAFSQYQ
jgi:hypothetical protein